MRKSGCSILYYCSCDLLYLCSYDTFCGYPPEIVKKMPKKDLAEEVIMIVLLFCIVSWWFYISIYNFYVYYLRQITSCFLSCLIKDLTTYILSGMAYLFYLQVWRLQAALGEQTEITKFSQQEYERLQNVSFYSLINHTMCISETITVNDP